MACKRSLIFSWMVIALTMPYCTAGEALRVDIAHTEPWGYYATIDRPDATRRAEATGIVVDIASALSRESGLSFENTLIPASRIGRDLKNGDADLSFITRADERDGDVIYLGYLFTLDNILLARPGTLLRNYDDILPLRIGILGDVPLNSHFDHDSNLKKIEFRDYEAMLDTLLAGRIDAVAGNNVSIELLLTKRGFGQTSSWPRLLLQKSQIWAQMSKRSSFQQNAKKLQEAIERLRNQGFFEHLIERYTAPQKARHQATSLKPAE